MAHPTATIKQGDIFHTNNNGECIVIEYHNFNNVEIEFLDTGFRVTTAANQLRNGNVKDLLLPLVYNVGYLGGTKFSKKNNYKLYNLWEAMLQRCYGNKKYYAYIGCRVSKRWHNFQTFCKDIIKMPNWNTPGFELDKDLRVLGNKVYGRKYCSFVPQEVNAFNSNFFIPRAQKLPKGVKPNGKGYRAVISIKNKQVHLGTYSSPEIAHQVYKQAKQKRGNQLVKLYRNKLHIDVVSNLLNLK